MLGSLTYYSSLGKAKLHPLCLSTAALLMISLSTVVLLLVSTNLEYSSILLLCTRYQLQLSVLSPVGLTASLL